ncbi:ubiquinol-cytochrome C chaperone-domain-containing protein [Podospora conica]|nr:ubiquinol-cytochrome C chaperone-domain-containing protein [Schizothecium conicum]
MACRSCNSALHALSRRPAVLLRPSTISPFLPTAAPTTPARRHLHATSRLQAAAPTTTTPAPPPKPQPSSVRERMHALRLRAADTVRKRGNLAQTYVIYGCTERLCELLTAQADYRIDPAQRAAGEVRESADGEEIGEPLIAGGVWHTDFDLPPTFSTWAHVTMLHMYLVVVRLRGCDAETYKGWTDQLVDHFFHAAEDRMVKQHDMTSRALRQRYLKDLFVQWRGLMLAYDEGLAGGEDAVLASAVWRNLFKARDDVDARALAAVVGFMRRCLREWDGMEDEPFLELLQGMGALAVGKTVEVEGQGVLTAEDVRRLFADMAREELRMAEVTPTSSSTSRSL